MSLTKCRRDRPQGDAVDRLRVRGTRLGELPGDAADLQIGEAAAKVITTAICRKTRKKSRMLSAECSAKLSAQSRPGAGKPRPPRPAQRPLELARLPAKTRGGIARKLTLGFRERLGIFVDGRLRDGLGPQLSGVNGDFGNLLNSDCLLKRPFWTQNPILDKQ